MNFMCDAVEGIRPVNVLDLGQHQLQATKKDDPGRLREGAGVAWVVVEAVALHNGPANAPIPGQNATNASLCISLSIIAALQHAQEQRISSISIGEPSTSTGMQARPCLDSFDPVVTHSI